MSVPSQIVLASGNAGKIREIAALFASLEITITPQAEFGVPEAEETGSTFVENALLKARNAAAIASLPAIADDSGISVDALDGRPGVRSARYAGENATDQENIDRLLAEMEQIPDDKRGAGFHCAAVLVYPNEEFQPVIVEAIWRGRILKDRLGTEGFGYDPVFFDVNSGKSGAQMSREEKNEVSHRGQAFKELRRLIAKLVD